jgi:hypothetical protein
MCAAPKKIAMLRQDFAKKKADTPLSGHKTADPQEIFFSCQKK